MGVLAYTLEDAAEVMHVSVPILRTLVDRPDFPAFRLGKRWVIPDADLRKWLSDMAAEKAVISTERKEADA